MHDAGEQERQQHNHRSPGDGMFPQPEALLRDNDGVYGECFAHRFVPEVTIPPPQGVSLGDVPEKRRPALERRVEDPHCDESANSVCSTDRECRSAVGVEGDYDSGTKDSKRQRPVDDLGSQVFLRRMPIAWAEICRVEPMTTADVQP